MTNQLSLRGILFRPRFMICIFGLIAADIGCTGADKPLSSDLTDQVLEKAGSSNSTAGRVTSFSVQTSPEETDSGVRKGQEAQGDKKGKGSRRKRKNDGVDWRTAMATAPDEWSDELKSQITAAGYDLNEVVEKIQKRQNAKDAKGP